MRNQRLANIIGVPSLLMALCASCCEERTPQVSEYEGRLRFGLDVAFELRFTSNMLFAFKGDLADWAGFALATGSNFDFNFDGQQAFEQTLKLDIDDDGVSERVMALGFGSETAEPIGRGFLSWRGDQYTFDEGYCFVLSWTEASAWLLSARCDEKEAALLCTLIGNEASCQACGADNECIPCSDGSVEQCIGDGRENLSFGGTTRPEPSPGPTMAGEADPTLDAGADASPEGRFDASGAVSLNPEGMLNVGGEIDVGGATSAELSTCGRQVDDLDSDGQSCGEGALEKETLCSEHWLDVNACYLAVQAAGLFGSACDVIDSSVCRGVY